MASKFRAHLTAIFAWAAVGACGPRQAPRTAAINVPLPPTAQSSTPKLAIKPSGDGDGDGVPDADDFCLSAAEDRDRCDDEDGCPEDDDHDGTPDSADDCRFKAGPADNKGCPIRPPPGKVVVYVESSDDDCMILMPVPFARDSAALGPDGQAIVEAIAECMNAHSDLLQLELRGLHAPEEHAANLSMLRAQVVQTALIARGIDARRLRPVVGESRQLDESSERLQSVQFVVSRDLTCPAMFEGKAD